MAKKIVLLLIVFLVCLVAGYCTYESPVISSRLEPTATSILFSRQQNYLVFHLDQFRQTSPQLLSVWAINISYPGEGSPSVSVNALFPTTPSGRTAVNWVDNFKLSAKFEPSPEILRDINQAYGVDWNGYIILDHYAVMVLSNYLTGIPANPNTADPLDAEAARLLLQEENMIWSGICQSIDDHALQAKEPFDWSLLIPDHYRMSMPMEDADRDWAEITRGGKNTSCEVAPLKN